MTSYSSSCNGTADRVADMVSYPSICIILESL